MTPIYKKTFDSPVLEELNSLSQKDWNRLKSIDITHEEYIELNSIFKDPDYNKERFDIGTTNLKYSRVIITINGENGIEYINNSNANKQQLINKPWYKKI